MIRSLAVGAGLLLLLTSRLAFSQAMCVDANSALNSGELTDSGGINGSYANNQNCGFLIQPASSGSIVLNFNRFDYESNNDTLTIYSGSDTSGPVLGRFTGASLPPSVVSTSGAMYILHQSDASNVRSGFKGNWTVTANNNCAATSFSMADNFPSSTYANNNGSVNFASNWREVGEADGTSAGELQVNGTLCSSDNCLSLGVVSPPQKSYPAKFVYRTLDLSSAVSAVLTFNYKTIYHQGNSLVRLGVSTDGGGTWQNLARYNVNATQIRGTAQQFDLTPFLGANVAIGFEVSGNQSRSSFYADDILITGTQAEACQALPLAFYQFEQANWSTPGSVIDSSGSAYHGDPVGSVTPFKPDMQKSCQVLNVPANFTADQHAALNTKLNLSSNVGNSGTLSFWYRSDLAWADGSARQLLDASTFEGTLNDRYFYLSLAAGGLDFGLQDDAGQAGRLRVAGLTFAANQWVHIAVTYDYRQDSAAIYVNGLLAESTTSLGLNGNMPNFSSLYVGDNRGSFLAAGMTANSANGQFDDLRIYNYPQGTDTIYRDSEIISPCQRISHYQIEHDSQGLTCEAESVTFKACVDASCSQLSSEPTSITMSQTGWVGGERIQFTGSVRAQLSVQTASTVTFRNASAQPNAPLRCYTGSGANSVQNCDMRFVDAGFEFFGTSLADKFLPDQVAEALFTETNLRAVQNTDGVCQALLQGEKDITLGVDCTSPNRCLTPFADRDTIITPDGESTGTVRLTFDSDGVASLNSLYYADAGRLTLRAQANVDGVNIDSGPISVDVMPSLLEITAQAEVLQGNLLNLGPFPAGEGFLFSLSAYGVLGDKPLPNYQPGQLQLSVQRVAPNSNVAADGQFRYANNGLISSVIEPRAFTDTALITFIDGQYSFNAHYTEVGIISVDVQDANYLPDSNTSQAIISSSGELTLGAFRPAYFSLDVEPPIPPATLQNACDSFSYLGQVIGFATDPSFRLTGKNAQGEVTKNYTAEYWHYVPDVSKGITYLDSSAYASIGTAKVNSPGSTAPQPEGMLEYDGSARVVIVEGSFRYQKVDSNYQAYPLVEPFEAAIDLVLSAAFLSDNDGVCYQSNYPDGCEAFSITGITGTKLHNGRLILEPNYGPETDYLLAPLKAQHYLNNRWQFNPADSCTDVSMHQSAGEIMLRPVGNPDITGNIEPVSGSGLLFEGKPLGNHNFALTGKNGGPGPNIRGQVEVLLDPSAGEVTWPGYMNFDWSGDGRICANNTAECIPHGGVTPELDRPSSILTFGFYRGNDRVIHWREVFN